VINTEEMNIYLRSLLPDRDKLLAALEAEAEEEQMPILQPEVAQLLETLISIHRSTRVLEIGTAIGYSTIRLAKAVSLRNGEVVTIELQEELRHRALENFRQAAVSHLITSLGGDAREVIPSQLGGREKNFDFIFVDAAKGQYPEFFKLCLPLLAPGGLFVADNVLYKGWVVPGSVFPRRKKTLVVRLRLLLKLLANHPAFNSTLLPIGDGVLVSCFKGNEVEIR
jgi:predicted O-methyltransferase YrrM